MIRTPGLMLLLVATPVTAQMVLHYNFALPVMTSTCEDEWPLVAIFTVGKGQSKLDNSKVSARVLGNVVDSTQLESTATKIPLCHGTSVDLQVLDITGEPLIRPETRGIRCDGIRCHVDSLISKQKLTIRSADGKDTDRLTLEPLQ